MPGSQDYYRVSEAAALLKVSPSTVRRWITTGKLPAQRVGPKTIRIKQEDLASILQPATPQTGNGRIPSGSPTAIPVEDAGLYRLMVENARELIALYDLEGRFIYASPSYYVKLGYAPEELIGRIAFTFIHPDDHADAQAAMEQVLTTGSGGLTEFRARHQDGHWLYFEGQGVVFRDETGHPALVLSTARDIAERQRIEEAVKAERQRLYETFMQAPAIIAVVRGPDHRYELANPLFLQLIGQRPIIGKPHREALAEPAGQGFRKLLDQVYRTGEPFVGIEMPVLLYRNRDGNREEAFFNLVYQPMRNEDDEVDGILIHAVEVTEQVLARRKVEESEARLRFMAESVPQKMFTADANGEVDYLNGQWLDFTGLSLEEIRDGGWTKFIHPEDIAETARSWQQSLETGEPFEFVHRLRHKDGSYRWHLSRARAMRDKQGRAVLWVGSNTDIHEHKRSEEEVKKSQDNLRFLAEASKILSSSLDYETTLRNIADLIVPYLADYTRIVVMDDNQEPREIAVRHSDPAKESLVKEIYAQYKDEGTPYGVSTLLSSGKSQLIALLDPNRYQILRDNPRLAAILKELGLRSYMGVPMKAGGRVIGSIVFASTREDRLYTSDDVALTEELASRAALAIENAKLFAASQEAIVLRDQLLSTASHELRTPLTTVKAYAQLLQRNNGDAAQLRAHAGRLLGQVERLENLINELLDTSRIYQGHLDFHVEPVDLTELSQEVLLRLDDAGEKTDRHTIVLDAARPVTGIWDRFRLDQVLTNLLTNALKYSPKGGEARLSIREQGDQAIVTVSDQGIGILRKNKTASLSRSNAERRFVRWAVESGWGCISSQKSSSSMAAPSR